MSFNLVMIDHLVGVYTTDEFDKPANIGSLPGVKQLLGRDKRTIAIKDAPVPSLIQFEFTRKYAIKIGKNQYFQIADLDGQVTSHGGFIGMIVQEVGGCLIHTVNDKKAFLAQIAEITLQITKHTNKYLSPIQRYALGLMFQHMRQAARDVTRDIVIAVAG